MITSGRCERPFALANVMIGAGWCNRPGRPLEFSQSTVDGTVELRGHLRAAGWMQFFPTGDGVPRCFPAGVLPRSTRSLVREYVARSGMVSLRLDVPLDILAADDPPDFEFGGRTPLETWAEDITATSHFDVSSAGISPSGGDDRTLPRGPAVGGGRRR